jgi:hypothetical protein
VLIALGATAAAIAARRGGFWPEWLHGVEKQRLRGAIAAADVRIDTTELDAGTVEARVVAFLEGGTARGERGE